MSGFFTLLLIRAALKGNYKNARKALKTVWMYLVFWQIKKIHFLQAFQIRIVY